MNTTPPSGWVVQQVMSVATAVAARLEQDGTTDEAELVAALQSETDVERILLRLVRAAQEARHNQQAIAERMQNLAARKARAARVEESCRGAIFAILDALGLSKWRHAEASVSISPGRASVRVTEAEALPPHLVRTTITPDLAAIREALDRGEVVPGVEQDNSSPVLTIRSA